MFREEKSENVDKQVNWKLSMISLERAHQAPGGDLSDTGRVVWFQVCVEQLLQLFPVPGWLRASVYKVHSTAAWSDLHMPAGSWRLFPVLCS